MFCLSLPFPLDEVVVHSVEGSNKWRIQKGLNARGEDWEEKEHRRSRRGMTGRFKGPLESLNWRC